MSTMITNSTKIDFNGIVSRANNGERITVKHLAREFKLKSPIVKQLIVDYYGSRVQFKRGRTGGIVFTA